jgi:hypothetical protein
MIASKWWVYRICVLSCLTPMKRRCGKLTNDQSRGRKTDISDNDPEMLFHRQLVMYGKSTIRSSSSECRDKL